MNEIIKKVLAEIDFVNRYNTLIKRHAHENFFEDPDVQKVKDIINSYVYSATYDSDILAFEIMDPSKLIDLTFTCDAGVVDLVLNVLIKQKYEGDAFRHLSREMTKGDRLPMPSFANYEELEEVLKEGLCIYEDIRDRLLPLIKK